MASMLFSLWFIWWIGWVSPYVYCVLPWYMRWFLMVCEMIWGSMLHNLMTHIEKSVLSFQNVFSPLVMDKISVGCSWLPTLALIPLFSEQAEALRLRVGAGNNAWLEINIMFFPLFLYFFLLVIWYLFSTYGGDIYNLSLWWRGVMVEILP